MKKHTITYIQRAAEILKGADVAPFFILIVLF